MRSTGLRQEYLVRILAAGFSLVILLLAAASALSVYRAQSIHASSVELVNAQITSWALANNLMVVQQRIGKELFYLRSLHPAEGVRILTEMSAAEAELQKMDLLVKRPEAASFRQLVDVSRKFADGIRKAVMSSNVDQDTLSELHGYREQFYQLAVEAVRREADRNGALQSAIQQQSASLQMESLYLLGGCLLLALACAWLTVRASHQFLRQLQWQSEELHRVSWHMLESQETTARRFSHEMHDELGQSLAGVRAMLVGMKPEDFNQRRKECIGLLDETIQNVRELSQLLRPVILDDFGLDAGLRWLGERFTSRTRIEVHYESDVSERLADDLETQFFRIAQEGLTNVARHSGATQVYMSLAIRGEKVCLTIEDNGRGMPEDPVNGRSSLGLVGMRARARQAGGELTIAASDEGGVKLEVWAPLRKVVEGAEQENTHFVS